MINYDKRNYRKHNDKNKKLIKKSLKECGAGRSIVIDKLAVMDNSTSDSSEFDFELLGADFDSEQLGDWGLEIVTMEDAEIEMPELASGDKEPIQQITFTLANEQADVVKQVITEIKKTDTFKYIETFGNENSNGNALYCLCEGYNG